MVKIQKEQAFFVWSNIEQLYLPANDVKIGFTFVSENNPIGKSLALQGDWYSGSDHDESNSVVKMISYESELRSVTITSNLVSMAKFNRTCLV